MLIGAKFWNDKKTHRIQTDNPSEGLLSKIFKRPYFESCGPTAAVTCLLALGHSVDIKCPGMYQIQPEQVLMDWLNDPGTERIRDLIRIIHDRPANRIPQFYPRAVKEVFGVQGAIFSWSGNNYDFVVNQLKDGKAIQLQLKKPGHYIAAVAFDDETGDLIYDDPWPGRPGLQNAGFNERMTREEFSKNIETFCIVYS